VHAISVCHAVLSGLPLRQDRILAFGMVLKMLAHEGKLLGLNPFARFAVRYASARVTQVGG
jgi:hypothetical protein